jgi:hypothetical protein
MDWVLMNSGSVFGTPCFFICWNLCKGVSKHLDRGVVGSKRGAQEKGKGGDTDHEDLLSLLLCHASRDGGGRVLLHRRRHLNTGHGGGSDVK